MRLLPRLFLTVLILTVAAGCSLAADQPRLEDVTRQAEEAGKFAGAITPVFSQLIRFRYPGSFKGVLQKTNGNYFVLQLVPDGETAQAWSQMVTLTGHQGLASTPFLTPELIAGTVSDRFQKLCPETFAIQTLGPLQTGGTQPHDGFALVMGCGSVQDPAGRHSETALVVAIKGMADYYTLQWAERGPASERKPDLTDRRWPERLNQFKPVILCPILPGEPAPYPSCVNQK
jgi:hypothetical protein